MQRYPAKCKDCESINVIRVYYKGIEQKDIFTVALCAPCLQSRAQLQTAREDKLPFPKLMAKIRAERETRVRRMIAGDRLKVYKGINPLADVKGNIANYWTEQLQGDTV